MLYKDETVWDYLKKPRMDSQIMTKINTDECKVLHIMGNSGDGKITMYQVFDGIYLNFNDFHMSGFDMGMQNIETVLCLEYCREGRSRQGLKGEELFSLEAGGLRVDRKVHHKGMVVYPWNHFHGITIGFQRNLAQESIKKAMPQLDCDIDELADKLCNGERPFIIKNDPMVNSIFQQLYQIPNRIRKKYYQIKVAELLLYLEALEVKEQRVEKPYFYVEQVEKIKEIHGLMISDLTMHYTLQELADRFDLSVTALKTCFKSHYGLPVHTYMTQYRLNQAASYLKTRSDMKVMEIAWQVGYESGSKFSEAFRKMFGMTPLEYRNRKN